MELIYRWSIVILLEKDVVLSKNELRLKLLEARQQYLDKHSARVELLKPKWEKSQWLLKTWGFPTDEFWQQFDPEIQFCDDKNLQDLWWVGRVIVSSAPLSGEVGRRIHYLVRDKRTDFIIGIVGLSSDLTIPIRDKFIGWTHTNKWEGKRINYLMNVQHCVATPELSKYLTGKLCALSTKSKEVQEHFERKYGHPLAAMTVTSLYGKSSMYNRLEGFIYLGTTKGFSSILIPLGVKEQMREDFKKTKGKHSEIYYNDDGTVRYQYGVVKGYQKLGKYAKVQSIDNFRGVYVVPLATNYKEFLRQETDELTLMYRKDFNTVVREWKKRWYLPRLERLKEGLTNNS